MHWNIVSVARRQGRAGCDAEGRERRSIHRHRTSTHEQGAREDAHVGTTGRARALRWPARWRAGAIQDGITGALRQLSVGKHSNCRGAAGRWTSVRLISKTSGGPTK